MSRPASKHTGRSGAPRRAVVVGGGMAGMLAAAALSGHADVTVVERDALPDGPKPRKGLPQAQHVHVLWSGGARAMESLVPGTTERWLAAGARRVPLPTGLVSLQAQGWVRRFPEMQFMIACTRDLLDWVVREQVAALPGVTVLDRTELLGLEGDLGRVTGVRVRATRPAGAEGGQEPEATAASEGAGEQVLEADLVVDATGRGSRASVWLEELGLPQAPSAEVDSGLAYASRLFRAPEGTADYPLVNVQSDAREPRPGQTTTIVPVEGGRWLVTLSGTRGGQPTKEAAAFESFARGVRDPVVGELIAHAEPLTEVTVTHSTVNRRHFFEKSRSWPEGLVVLGDAVATYNPVYGHGLSVAAQGAVSLREELTSHDLAAPGLARRVQRAVARPVGIAWELATGQDILYPGATASGKQPGAAARLLRRYVDRLMFTATGRPLVARAFFDVVTLSAPLAALIRPAVLLAVLRGPRRPAPDGPPLTAAERAAVQGPREACSGSR